MKKDEKTSKGKTADSERETRVLLEEIRQQVQTVAEGHGAIIRKLDEHTQIFGEHGQRLDRIEMVITDTNDRVKSIEKNFDARITKLEEKVSI